MFWKEAREVFGHSDRPDTRPAPSVRNAEGFVQIQMADVCAHVAWSAKSDLGIHVGAIHINLAAIFVDDLAHFVNCFLEYSVGGWVGHHQRGKGVTMSRRFGSQIVQIDIALGIARDAHDFHSSHNRASRVGSMC